MSDRLVSNLLIDRIPMNPNQWLCLPRHGIPAGMTELSWADALAIMQAAGATEVSLCHNVVSVELSRRQALQLRGTPIALVEPRCPICSRRTSFRVGHYGAFFACCARPICRGRVPAAECIETDGES